MAPHQTRQFPKQNGLTLVEVLLASVILALTASSILTAMVAGHDASMKVAKYQQAHMLASNLMEEIKRFGNFENGDYWEDTINGSSSESGESCSPARDCFDDKTDFAGYADGDGVAAAGQVFLDYAGNSVALFDGGSTGSGMYRSVDVLLNDLNGSITDFTAEQPYLEVHVTVYDGPLGSGSTLELVRLRRVFGGI